MWQCRQSLCNRSTVTEPQLRIWSSSVSLLYFVLAYHFLVVVLLPVQCCASVVYAIAPCLSVASQCFEWIDLAYSTLYRKEIWLSLRIRVVPSGNLSQTLYFEKFCHGTLTVASVVILVRL